MSFFSSGSLQLRSLLAQRRSLFAQRLVCLGITLCLLVMFGVAALYSASAKLPDGTAYITARELTRGTILSGQTRMADNVMVKFKLSVLSIATHSSPATDSILARIEDKLFYHTGVLAGMSGSPVYYEDKLVGAIAYTVPFLKEPIVGITPIAAMLDVIAYAKRQQKQTRTSAHPIVPYQRGAALPLPLPLLMPPWFAPALTAAAVSVPKPSFSSPAQQHLRPITLPLAISGGFYLSAAETQALSTAAQTWLITPGGSSPFSSAAAQPAAAATAPPATAYQDIVPGDLIGINLVRGSLNISAFGTVTYKDSSQLLGFGHPMGLLGSTALPLYTAAVDAVVPRLDFSYKVGRLLSEIGTVTQDRQPGILGIQSAPVPRLPVTIQLDTELTNKTLQYEIVRARPYMEQMTGLVLLNSFVRFGQLGGKTAFAYTFTVTTTQEAPFTLSREGLYGDVRSQLLPMVQTLQSLLQTIQDNPYAAAELKAIKFTLKSDPTASFATMTQVHYPSTPLTPGSTFPITIDFSRFQGTTFSKTIPYTLPSTLSNGNYVISLGNEQVFSATEFRTNPARHTPHDLKTLFAELARSPRISTLVTWMPLSRASLKLTHQVPYPQLPSTKARLLSALPQTGSTRLTYFHTARHRLQTPILGTLHFTITVQNP